MALDVALRANRPPGAVSCPPIDVNLPRESEVRSVAFSPDGRTVLTGNVAGAQLSNVATGEPIGPPLQHEGTITVAAFSPNRQHALSSEVTLRNTSAVCNGRIG